MLFRSHRHRCQCLSLPHPHYPHYPHTQRLHHLQYLWRSPPFLPLLGLHHEEPDFSVTNVHNRMPMVAIYLFPSSVVANKRHIVLPCEYKLPLAYMCTPKHHPRLSSRRCFAKNCGLATMPLSTHDTLSPATSPLGQSIALHPTFSCALAFTHLTRILSLNSSSPRLVSVLLDSLTRGTSQIHDGT